MDRDRRQFIVRSLAWLGAAASAPLGRARRARAEALPLRSLLESSPFVYVSPLRSDRSESTCHAEVWYAWLDDAVVVIASSNCWKAQAIAQGSHARVFRESAFRIDQTLGDWQICCADLFAQNQHFFL